MATKKGGKADDPYEQMQRDLRRAKRDPRIGQLVAAAKKGDAAAVRRLLAAGADPNAPAPDDWGVLETPVWGALIARSPEVIRALGEGGADLNDGFPSTPLCVAVNIRNLELLRALVEAGADVNRGDRSYHTPLLTAVIEGYADVIEELLKLGADPNHVVKKQRHDTVTNFSPLQYAALGAPKAILKMLKAAAGEQGQSKELAGILLCTAAGKGDLAAVKRAIEQDGLNADAMDADRRTPLHHAAAEGRAKVVRYLLDRGADVNKPCGKKPPRETALQAAVTWGKLDVVKMLIEAGANAAWADPAHPEIDAAYIAREMRRKNVLAYLQSLPNAKGGKTRSAAMPKLAGVTTFDTNDAVVLVAGGVEDVAGAFARLRNAKTWDKDAHGKKVKLSSQCFAVWKLIDQAWTAVMKLQCRFEHWPSARDAQALSKTQATRSLFVANSDTGGATQYIVFDNGNVVEVFDYSSARDGDGAEQMVTQYRKAYGIDLSSLDGMQVKDGKSFASKSRKVNIAKVKNDLDFVDETMKQHGAFVPFLPDEWPASGTSAELTFEDFGADEIERLDYVAV